jgi:hypothetical protein
MKPVRRTALQGEAIGALGKAWIDPAKAGPEWASRAWCKRVKRPRETKPVRTCAVDCGSCRRLEEVAPYAGMRMPSTKLLERSAVDHRR